MNDSLAAESLPETTKERESIIKPDACTPPLLDHINQLEIEAALSNASDELGACVEASERITATLDAAASDQNDTSVLANAGADLQNASTLVAELREAHGLLVKQTDILHRLIAEVQSSRDKKARTVVQPTSAYADYANMAPVPEPPPLPPSIRPAAPPAVDEQRLLELEQQWDASPFRPKVVFIGAQKTGSMLLYGAFAAQQSVVVSPKDSDWFGGAWMRGPRLVSDRLVPDILEQYAMSESWPSEPYIVDMTSDYFLRSDALKRIRAYCGPDVKIIFVLRQPVEYSFSLYNNGLRNADWANSFFDWVDGDHTRWSGPHGDTELYSIFPDFLKSVATVFEIFPRENVLMLNFETDIIKDPIGTVRKVFDFCGLPQIEFDVMRDNIGAHPRYLFSRHTHLFVNCEEGNYLIPANTLVWCGGINDLNRARWWTDPSDAAVSAALQRQSKWTQEISGAVYKDLFESKYKAMTETLMRQYSLPLEHWFHSARSLRYREAPPPSIFRVS